MRGRFETIDDYIAAFPPHVRALLDAWLSGLRNGDSDGMETVLSVEVV